MGKDYYRTSFKPILDLFGNRIGMLGVGVWEGKYIAIRKKMLTLFIFVTLAGMVLAIGLGCLFSEKITRPVKQLIHASLEVSDGNPWPDLGPISKGEMGVLQNTFRHMIVSLAERDRRRMVESEKRLLNSEKQASMGRLAAGVAHEINNPLTGVLTYAHMLLRRGDLAADIRADLETIVSSTERVRDIVKGLLEFSRQRALHREPTNMNELLHATIALMQNQALVKGLGIQFHPGKKIPMITIDRSQLQSVFLNMIINALDATARRGTITLSSRPVHRAERLEGIEISISDTGKGIPNENLERIFDPFFTTKDIGKGTGLGLAVSLGIVQRHGGTLSVESTERKGSMFTVFLPIDGKRTTNENSHCG